MPLGRFRQITSAIQTRKYHATRAENSRFSWMTRTLAQYIAAGYMTDGKTPNTALTDAGKLTLDDVEAVLLGSAAEAPRENKEGSYERFMGTLGARGGAKPGQ